MSNLDPTFSAAVNSLAKLAGDVGGSLVGTGQPKWMYLADMSDVSPSTLRETFSRNGTAKLYADALAPGVSYRDAQVAKIQGDVLSSLERDVNMRYRSRVRMFAHAAARYMSHGLPEGPATGGIVGFVKLLMDRQDT